MWAIILYRTSWVLLAGVSAWAFHNPQFLVIALMALLIRNPKQARLSVQDQFEQVNQNIGVLSRQIQAMNQPKKETKPNEPNTIK